MYRKNSYARLIFIITVLAICSIVILRYNKVASSDRKTLNTIEKYGIFLGVEKENFKKIKDYDLIVIDADNLDKDDIKSLKKQGNKKIFSYINIGSVEEFREYYNDFKNLTLEDYENWEDEKWVDVTNKKWKKHIANLSKKLKFKGIDGFFADNTDVYYHYKDPKVYSSLLEILTDIKKTGLPCIVNGGDTFISKAISENTLKDLVYGINQETVLTKIDFKNNAFYTSSKDTREYFEKYLKKCKDFGLKIYLTEYTRDEKIKNKIRDFCKKNRYNCYISSTIELSNIDE
jgi:hypothetical protein